MNRTDRRRCSIRHVLAVVVFLLVMTYYFGAAVEVHAYVTSEPASCTNVFSADGTGEPSKPEKPVTPVGPTKPEKPAKPSKPSANPGKDTGKKTNSAKKPKSGKAKSKKAEKVSAVDTSDSSGIEQWMVLELTSIIVLIGVLVVRKSKNW